MLVIPFDDEKHPCDAIGACAMTDVKAARKGSDATRASVDLDFILMDVVVLCERVMDGNDQTSLLFIDS